MNVLMFVMTMLMLLSLLTYARLETFRSSQLFEAFFEHYMQKMERGHANKISEIIYDDIHVKKQAAPTEQSPPKQAPAPIEEGKPEQKKPATPIKDARPRFSLAGLFERNKKDSSELQLSQMVGLLKALLVNLYGNQPFFKKMEQERPHFLDELIKAMMDASTHLPEEKKLKKASDLANLKLTDEQLDAFLYKILKGGAYLDILENNDSLKPSQESEEEKADIDTAENSASEEYESPLGYFSLLDFITLEPASKVRVYLAPEEVLNTIYSNPEVVHRIMHERQELYRQASRGVDVKSLQEAFKNQFDAYRNPAVDPSFLDYSVTKTNPKKYAVKENR